MIELHIHTRINITGVYNNASKYSRYFQNVFPFKITKITFIDIPAIMYVSSFIFTLFFKQFMTHETDMDTLRMILLFKIIGN